MGQDETSKRQVFVLGAGFTRAFVPGAPLLVDDYRITELREQFCGFKHAARVLELAVVGGESKVDLEALLTRLGGMPYDSRDALREFAVLESALQHKLISRIEKAKAGEVKWERLAGFARFLLKSGASVVTFNYDDVLDQTLWEVHRVTDVPPQTHSYWHPDGGYGFYCRPSRVCVTDHGTFMDQPSTRVLKLHGSVNWRSRLGEPPARGPSALLHHEEWLGESHMNSNRPTYTLKEIEKYLEPEPFIVPPVHIKSGLSLHPVLRVVWDAAYKALSAASEVVFIGYSLPETDLAARMLFKETLGGRVVRSTVINLAADADAQRGVRAAYRKVLTIDDECFDFSGALSRIECDFSHDDADTSG